LPMAVERGQATQAKDDSPAKRVRKDGD